MRRAVSVLLCGTAIAGTACGEDERLSRLETGAAIGRICSEVTAKGQGLNGEPRNDTAILDGFLDAFEQAIDRFRELDVHEDLAADRDAFVDLSERQLPVMREAQALAESGDEDAYRAKVGEVEAFRVESDKIALRLGAAECAA